MRSNRSHFFRADNRERIARRESDSQKKARTRKYDWNLFLSSLVVFGFDFVSFSLHITHTRVIYNRAQINEKPLWPQNWKNEEKRENDENRELQWNGWGYRLRSPRIVARFRYELEKAWVAHDYRRIRKMINLYLFVFLLRSSLQRLPKWIIPP